MMTEEQHLANALTAFIGRPLDNPLSRSEIMETARIALAALTQTASPDLKFPDGWVRVPRKLTREMSGIYHNEKCVYGSAQELHDALLDAAAHDVPHTAPIEPICATGGAEWVKCSDRMPVIDERTWRTPLPVLVLCELGVIPAYARTYTTIGGERKVGFMASLTLGNARGKHPESLYSSEVLTQVTMWREMPAAPEEK